MNLKQFQNLSDRPIAKILNLIRHFGGKSPFPAALCLALTYRCNLDCSFCYRPSDKRETFGDMTFEDAALIERNIAGSFPVKPRIHFWGGEPTITKDFIRILKHFDNRRYRLSLTTNGIEIDSMISELVAIRSLRDINLSLNTPDYSSTLQKLEIFERLDRDKKIYITLNFPIHPGNQHQLAEVVDFFDSSYARCLSFQHSKFQGQTPAGIDVETIASQIIQIKKRRGKMLVVFRPDIRLSDLHTYYHDPHFPGPKLRCIAPWFAPFVEPNGDVIPCDEMAQVMGNLKEENLRDIWNNQTFKTFRSNIQKQGLTQPVCERCDHRQYY